MTAYDAYGRPEAVTRSTFGGTEVGRTEMSWDVEDLLTEVRTFPPAPMRVAKTSYERDALGRVVKLTRPDLKAFQYSYVGTTSPRGPRAAAERGVARQAETTLSTAARTAFTTGPCTQFRDRVSTS